MSKQEVYGAQSAYDMALATYEAFRLENKDVIEEHDHLAVALTESLEQLKTTLRENQPHFGKSFAGFTISTPKKYDVEKLKSELGDESKPYIKTKESVDSDAFEKAYKDAHVTQDTYDAVVSTDTPRISGGPKPPSIFQR